MTNSGQPENEVGCTRFVSTGSPTVSADPSITAALASVGLSWFG
jgi:hypothetical protein